MNKLGLSYGTAGVISFELVMMSRLWNGAAGCFLATVLVAITTSCGTDGSRILVYPFGHCLNSHLLNAEKVRIDVEAVTLLI